MTVDAPRNHTKGALVQAQLRSRESCHILTIAQDQHRCVPAPTLAPTARREESRIDGDMRETPAWVTEIWKERSWTKETWISCPLDAHQRDRA